MSSIIYINTEMSILDSIYLVAGLASIGGFSYAIYYARKSRKIKALVYETLSPVPLATAYSPEDDYKLAVTYQRKRGKEERFESVFTRFLRFANLGRESIRREDITPANPIKIKIEGVRTLDITLAGVSRKVNNIKITNQFLRKNSTSAKLTFDYLDYKDGGLIKILTVTGEGAATLTGDVIGMPGGIKNVEETGSESWLGKIGRWLAVLFVSSSFIISIVSYYWVTGSWQYAWLFILPFIALIIPLIFVLVVAATVWPSGRPSFPASLKLPDWFRSLELFHYRSVIEFRRGSQRETLDEETQRLKEDKLMYEKIKRLKEERRQRRPSE